MAKPGARASDSDTTPAELKLRRIVKLLARAEARAWLSGLLPETQASASFGPSDAPNGEFDAN